jgi:hypothetical protein
MSDAYYGNFVRSFRGDPPGPFAQEINRLSLLCYLMKSTSNTPLQRLSSITPDGTVQLTRIGDVEYVVIASGIPIIIIELLSSGTSFSGRYNITLASILKSTDLTAYTNPYTQFSAYFTLNPLADLIEESCVCVVNNVSNLAADNLLGTGSSHYDDWHYIDFQWIGFPYWMSGSYQISDYYVTMFHPGLTAGTFSTHIHWSHSPITYGSYNRSHILRHIDQEKRIYRPGEIDLSSGSDDLMTTTALQIFGKKPFTYNSNGDLTSYNEKMKISGPGTYSCDSDYNMVVWFYPFIPYMHEIPNFNIFAFANNDSIYHRSSTPENGSAFIRAWSLEYTDMTGTVIDIPKHSDTATFTTGGDSEVIVSPPRPGSLGGGTDPSGSWTDTYNKSWDYSATISKTVPIGPVCNLNDLFITNTLAITGSFAQSRTDTHTKSSNFGIGVYNSYPSWPSWWDHNLSPWEDTSTIVRSDTSTHDVSISVSSIIQFGDVVIESGAGSMTYAHIDTKSINDQNYFTVFALYPDPWYPPTWVMGQDFSGSRTDAENESGNSARNLIVFSALDYDSESNFTYENEICSAVAVIYKRITISNVINRSRTVSSTIDTLGSPLRTIISTGGGFNNWSREPNDNEKTIADNTVVTGTRKVEYVLYANVAGRVYTKTLATFNGSLSSGVGSGSGQRCYGAVVKLTDKELLITYSLENFLTDAGAQSGYDSPLNYEDWNTHNETAMWEVSKRIVGIINLSNSDNFGVELFDEQDPIASEVYSISKKTVNI